MNWNVQQTLHCTTQTQLSCFSGIWAIFRKLIHRHVSFFFPRPNIAKSMGDSVGFQWCQSTWGFQKSTARLIVEWIEMHHFFLNQDMYSKNSQDGEYDALLPLPVPISLYLLEFFPCKSLRVSSAYLCPLGRCGTTSDVYDATCRIGRLVNQQNIPSSKIRLRKR